MNNSVFELVCVGCTSLRDPVMPAITWHFGFVSASDMPADLPAVSTDRGAALPVAPAWLPLHLGQPPIVIAAATCDRQAEGWRVGLADGHGIIHGAVEYESATRPDGRVAAPGSFLQIVIVEGYPAVASRTLPESTAAARVTPRCADGAPPTVTEVGVQAAPSASRDGDAVADQSDGRLLEDELLPLLVATGDPRAAEFARLRWGWAGGGCWTLDAIGSAQTPPLTRERVRQIMRDYETSIRGRCATGTSAPVLDRALELVTANLPTTPEAFSHMLLEAGLTRSLLVPGAVRQAASILQRPLPFREVEIRGRIYLLPSDTVGDADGERRAEETVTLIETVARVARSQVRKCGATRVRDVADAAAAHLGESPQDAQVVGLLACHEDFRWLDKRGGWFWLRDLGKNSVLARVNKILSVTGRATVQDMLEGIKRDERMRDCAINERLLEKMCSQCDGLTLTPVDGSVVVAAVHKIDMETALEGAELRMARILREQGPVLSGERFRELSERAGVAVQSYYNRTRYSPIIRELDGRRFCLRGLDQPDA